MSINPYLNIETSTDYQVYEFDSLGKEMLRKRVLFDLVDADEQIYNLALCTILADGTQDCASASRNGDMDTVLETVAHIALIYTNRFPERKIFFGGSDSIRSRKYQMGINAYLDTMKRMFVIEGVIVDKFNSLILREDFQTGKNYTGFIFTRKK
jgi:hypothetical protein